MLFRFSQYAAELRGSPFPHLPLHLLRSTSVVLLCIRALHKWLLWAQSKIHATALDYIHNKHRHRSTKKKRTWDMGAQTIRFKARFRIRPSAGAATQSRWHPAAARSMPRRLCTGRAAGRPSYGNGGAQVRTYLRACDGRTRQSRRHGTTWANHGPQRHGRSGNMQGMTDVHRVTVCLNLPHTRPTERSEDGGDVVIPTESRHQSSCKIEYLLQSV